MTAQYIPLTNIEKDAHTKMANSINGSGIYPSGEAHFFDVAQNSNDIPAPSGDSIFQFDLLDSPFSNSVESYVIDDFNIFNPYIHNSGPSTGELGYEVITSELLNIAVERYNIYNIFFRTFT